MLCESVQNHLWTPLTTWPSKALCSPPLLLLSLLHLHAALEIWPRCVYNYYKHTHHILHHAKVCMTTFELSSPSNSVGLCAAHHICSQVLCTCVQPRKIDIDVLVTSINIFTTSHTTQKHAQPLGHLTQWGCVQLTTFIPELAAPVCGLINVM